MKRILALAYLGFMLFSLSSTAENAISINILGNEQEDARFYFLECREEILNEIKIRLNDKDLDETKKAKRIFLIGGINSIIYAYINDEITSENLIGVLELYLK